MKFSCPLIACADLQATRAFYEQVMGLPVVMDLGANVSYGEAPVIFAVQGDFAGLIGAQGLDTTYGGGDHELVFEEEAFDDFLARLSGIDGIRYLHAAKEYPWGQRVVRFYDPDAHIIEVGESMASVFARFHAQGMNVEEVARRTQHPVEYVRMCLK